MSSKIFNNFSVIAGVLGGFFCQWLGGWDALLKALVGLVILDYFTGVLKAIYTKQLSSSVGYKGLIRKIMIFVVISTAVIVQSVLGESIPLREISIVFFICNEGISLLENSSYFIPIPTKLKDTLIQLREEKEDSKHE